MEQKAQPSYCQAQVLRVPDMPIQERRGNALSHEFDPVEINSVYDKRRQTNVQQVAGSSERQAGKVRAGARQMRHEKGAEPN